MSQRFLVPALDVGSRLPSYSSGLQSVYKSSEAEPSGIIKAATPPGGTRRSLYLPSQQPGRAYNADGLDDNIETGFNVPTTAFTFEVRCTKAALSGTFPTIFGGRSFGLDGAKLYLNSSDSYKLTTLIDTSAGISNIVSTFIPTAGEFFHAVWTWDGAVQNLYVNGVLIGSTAATGTITPSDPIKIFDSDDGTYTNWEGKLSRFRLWSEALTADQARDLYLNDVLNSVPRDNLEIEYKCEDQHPTLALDSSGNGRHGTKTGHSVSTFHYSGSDLPRQTGENEQGFSRRWYQTQSRGAKFGTGWFADSASGSIEARFVYGGASSRLIVAAQDISTNRCYLASYAGKLGGGLGSDNWTTIVGTTSLVAGQEYHGKLEWDATTVRLYLDDTLEYSGPRNGNPTTIQQVAVGGYLSSDAYDWEGYIWDVKLTNSDGTYRYFPMTQDAGSVLTDEGNATDSAPLALDSSVTLGWVNIPAATATTDALGGTLTYSGKSPIDAKLKQSWCGNFNGTTGYASFPAEQMHNGGDITLFVEAACNSAASSSEVLIARNHPGTGAGSEFSLYINTAEKLGFYVTGLRAWFTDDVLSDITQLRSYAVVYRVGVGPTMYVDGVEWSSSQLVGGDAPAVPQLTVETTLGAQLTSGAANAFWGGRLWNARIYQGALSADQILELHRTKYTSVQSGQELLFHAPLAEGEGSPVTFDVVSGAAGTIVAEDTTVGGTFWGRQDEYHYNASEGHRVLENQSIVSHLMPSWVGQGMSWTSGADDPFGGTKAMRLAHTNTVTGTHRIYRSGQGATNGDHMVFWIKPDNLATHNTLYLQWTSGAGSYYNLATRTFESGTYSDFRHDTYGDWHRLSWVMDNVGINVLQISIMPSGQPYTVVTPINTTDGASIYYGFVANKELADPYPGNQETSIKVPQTAYGWSSTIGPSWRPPALHNGAESGIDWTGGIAFPQPALPVNILNDGPADFTKWPTVATSWSATSQEVQGLPVYKLTSTAATTPQYGALQTLSITSGQKYSFSVLLKDAGARYAQIGSAIFGGLVRVNIDLETGTIGSNDFFTEYASLTYVGNGWYLFEGVDTATITASNGTITLGFASGPTSGRITSFTGDGSAGILCAGFMVESGVKRRQVYNPAGIINGLDTDWYAFDTPANPHFQRHISDGYGNILKIDRRVHVKNAVLGSDLEGMRGYTADLQGLLADNFNRADQSTLGLDWLLTSSTAFPLASDKAASSATGFANGPRFMRALKTANQEVEVIVDCIAVAGTYFYAMLRSDENGDAICAAIRTTTSGTQTVRIGYLTSSSFTAIGGQLDQILNLGTYTFKFNVDGDTATVFIDGVQKWQVDISSAPTPDTNRLVGFSTSYDATRMTIDSFKARDI